MDTGCAIMKTGMAVLLPFFPCLIQTASRYGKYVIKQKVVYTCIINRTLFDM